MRTFEDIPATREHVPLLCGLIGPSGSGKTMSALRLATGIQRVSGGDIYVIDTEARRSLHYADRFKFRHLAFGAPFGPLDYLAAVEHCFNKGGRTIIVDSMSHEHEGPGGVLEMHAAEVERMSHGDERRAEGVKMLAWSKPKSERRRFINTLMQMQANFIFCFRAKEKLKPRRRDDPDYKKGPEELGFQAIAGAEFVYEMTVKALLLPGANGVPTWKSDLRGEEDMIKLPIQFHELFAKSAPLSEDIGQALAEWAAGTPPKPANLAETMAAITATNSRKELLSVAKEHSPRAWTDAQRAAIKDAIDKHGMTLDARA